MVEDILQEFPEKFGIGVKVFETFARQKCPYSTLTADYLDNIKFYIEIMFL